MKNSKRETVLGLVTGELWFDAVSFIIGFKPLHATKDPNMGQRLRNIAWNLLNLFAICFFLYTSGMAIVYGISGILATWVVYRIAAYVFSHGLRTRFRSEEKVV